MLAYLLAVCMLVIQDPRLKGVRMRHSLARVCLHSHSVFIYMSRLRLNDKLLVYIPRHVHLNATPLSV
jgi:hypothetical protein